MQLVACKPADYATIGLGGSWRGYNVPEGGLEPAEVLSLLQALARRLDDAPGWGTWFGVSGAEVVVSIAIKGTPDDGCVEIGYGTAMARRGRGHATAAVLALLPELAARGITLVRAETALRNRASGRVQHKAGFQPVGHRVDAEDGALTQWARALP